LILLKVELLTNVFSEHTMLVTKDGVEVLTARLPDSPGGKVPMPGTDATVTPVEATNGH